MRLPLLNLFLASSAAFATPVFIGTDAKAIYFADFDAASGKLTTPVAVADYSGPGWIALHPTKPVLYAAGKPNTPFPDQTGSVAAFSISADHKLTFINEASSGGKDACHLAVDATGSTVAVANYGDGNVSTIKLEASGALGKTATSITPTGNGPNAERQKGPHSHAVYFSKSNQFLFEPDLGLDKVHIYKFNAADSTIAPSSPAALETAPGAGPRHFAISPDEKNGYVINELDNTITAADYDAKKGSFTAIQTVPTLPENFTGKSSTAEVEVHPNGKFVYGSNRSHDSIAVYSRDAVTGKLTLIQHAPVGGKTPRHFKIDPSGKWLLVGYQSGDGISVLPLDPATGKLGTPSAPVAAPKPICILFAK
jgi:6-phosphogluconolactonase